MITRTDTPRRQALIRAVALDLRSKRKPVTKMTGWGSRRVFRTCRNASSTVRTIRVFSALEPHGFGTLNVGAPLGS